MCMRLSFSFDSCKFDRSLAQGMPSRWRLKGCLPFRKLGPKRMTPTGPRDCKESCFRATQSSERNLWKITNQFSCGLAAQFHIAQQTKIWYFEKNNKIPQLWQKWLRKKKGTNNKGYIITDIVNIKMIVKILTLGQ